jgi:hypothetical protein
MNEWAENKAARRDVAPLSEISIYLYSIKHGIRYADMLVCFLIVTV